MKKHKEYGLRFYKAFDELKKDYPKNINKYDSKKIRGVNKKNRFRLRIGDYRDIFEVNNNEIKIIYVLLIDSRGDVYK
ncbi:type II toxin-antitoxin system RelE/ParE family toxin [uncultured Anaerococcus sp.]|uniref:type II toxin-antitoxin system RelE family toxin n=1 Tax=uncultured Anaerococcus sp. TaxID=293428 RepID=UPI0025DDBD2D|nr:type II toxin-antitoxin system RelE/ParE family toxin [uncultured Anaerococcus sp.]